MQEACTCSGLEYTLNICSPQQAEKVGRTIWWVKEMTFENILISFVK
jgi:hypothetical protein